MNKELRQILTDAAYDFCNGYDYGFRGDYSGRGMFGRQCLGIVCEDPLDCIEEFHCYLLDNNLVDKSFRLPSKRTDNMGYKMIVYFPSITTEDLNWDNYD